MRCFVCGNDDKILTRELSDIPRATENELASGFDIMFKKQFLKLLQITQFEISKVSFYEINMGKRGYALFKNLP